MSDLWIREGCPFGSVKPGHIWLDGEVPRVIAPLPPMLQECCIAAPGLLATLIVGKSCDHLRICRREAIFASRYRLEPPRVSLARWAGPCAAWLRPICESIRTGVMGGGT